MDLGSNGLHLSASADGIHHAAAVIGCSFLELGLQMVVLDFRLDEVRAARAHLEVHATAPILHSNSVDIATRIGSVAATIRLANAAARGVADFRLDSFRLAVADWIRKTSARVGRLNNGRFHGFCGGIARRSCAR